MMRRSMTLILGGLFALTVWTGAAFAQHSGAAIKDPDAIERELENEDGNRNIWEKYTDFLDSELVKISEMDLYGVTSQLPQGYLSVKWDWGVIRAKNRYDDKRHLGPVMPPIQFKDGTGKELISIDMGLSGHGGGHTFQMSYGIIDELDWYIELPFTYMTVSFDPQIKAMDPAIGKLLGVNDVTKYTGYDFFKKTLPMLGRATPKSKAAGEWLLGDINTGFSWNVFRNERLSVALTPRVFLPTGHVPDPNNNLTYGTGPEIETGIGGWAVGFTQGYDVRLFKYSFWLDVIFSTEFGAAYGFEQNRDYPTNFLKPDDKAVMLDPASFPDLSNLEGNFQYTPGWSVNWTAQLNIQLAVLGLGIGYGMQHSQEPELKGDPAFVQMARSLQLLGQQSLEAVQLAASLSLLPLYIPADISFQWTKVIDGYNAIVYDNFYQLTVKAYIPIWR